MSLHMYNASLSCGKVYIASQTNINHGYHLVFLPHLPFVSFNHYVSIITSLHLLHTLRQRCPPSPLFLLFSHLSGVVILNPPLAIRVHKARTAAIALRATAATHATLIAAEGAAEAEQDCCNKEACERCPRETHQVPADAGLESGGAEGVAAFDDPGAVDY
jgi:hypothetical protein